MRVTALIPARGGSQRAPRKNIAQLGNKPLIGWTIDTARDSKCFDKIIVSTDDHEIADIADYYAGEKICQQRPPELALADTPMFPVVRYVYKHNPCDVLVLLQPTSPFRSVEDIKAALSLLTVFKGDSVVSVTDVPGDLVFEIGHAKRLRPRPDFVTPNGAIYGITGDAIERGEDWYSGVSYAYKMSKDHSLDIDTPLDLEIARMMVEKLVAA
jgi:CMP-N,N'-diacetyllegionaminic acid synthase